VAVELDHVEGEQERFRLHPLLESIEQASSASGGTRLIGPAGRETG
jgi:hypothetical protein